MTLNTMSNAMVISPDHISTFAFSMFCEAQIAGLLLLYRYTKFSHRTIFHYVNKDRTNVY